MSYQPRNNNFLYLPDGWDAAWKTAKAASASTPANIAVIGDSISQGFLTTDNLSKGYFELVRTYLQTKYTLGADYYPVQYSVASEPTILGTMPFVWNATGSIAQGFDAYARWVYNTASVAGNVVTFTTPYACTAIDIIYNEYANGTFQYTVDGGSAVTITVSGKAGNGSDVEIKRISLTSLANTTHTIVIKAVSATAVLVLSGIITYASTTVGLRFARFGVSGEQINNYATNDMGVGSTQRISLFQGYTPQTPTIANNTGFGFPTQPHLTLIEFGVNDCISGVAVATFADLHRLFVQSLRRGQANASIAIIGVSNPDGVNSDVRTPWSNAANWYTYLNAMQGIAQAYNCAFINIHAKWGEYGVSSGFQTSGNAHPTDAGHADIANLINSII